MEPTGPAATAAAERTSQERNRQVGAIRGWFGRSPARGWALIFGLYLAARVVILTGGRVFTSFDAQTYAPRPGHPDGGLVSFVGHAPRPWGLPVFYALFGSDGPRTVAQWAIATVCWAFFAWEIGRQLRTGVARYLTVIAILLLDLLPSVTSWDFAILTESMTLSLGVLVLGLFLQWRRTSRTAPLVGMVLAAIWWTFLRPDIRVFTAILVFALVLVAWKARRERATLISALAAALVLVAGMAWYSAIAPRNEQAMTAYDGDEISPPLPQDEHRLVYRLRVDASTNPELWHAFTTELGMPVCPEQEAFLGQSDWQGKAWAEAYRKCPALVSWVQARKDRSFWLIIAEKDPALAAKVYLQEVSLSLGGASYAHVPTVVPAGEKLVFPSRRYGLPVALLGLAVAFGVFWWIARRTPQQHQRRLVWFAATLGGAALLSTLATVEEVTGELGRFGVQESVAVRLAVIVLLGAALDRWRSLREAGQKG